MNEQSLDQEDRFSDKIDGAMLIIECYSDGEIGFSCDWQNDDTGITCMATILASLENKGISGKILSNLESVAVDEEQSEQLDKLNSFYITLQKIAEQNKRISDNDVVVPPIDASTLM